MWRVKEPTVQFPTGLTGGESLNVSEDAVVGALDSRQLELILLPTEKCNFRCTYCYEDFAIGRMGEEVITAIKSLIARRVQKLSALSISWFGGEPLLAKDIALDIGKYAHDMCFQNGVSFSGGFTTNGYHLDAGLLGELDKINHRTYQITLDGDEEFHDRTRVLANGRGTFKKIPD